MSTDTTPVPAAMIDDLVTRLGVACRDAATLVRLHGEGEPDTLAVAIGDVRRAAQLAEALAALGAR